jgi:hypothetical protein
MEELYLCSCAPPVSWGKERAICHIAVNDNLLLFTMTHCAILSMVQLFVVSLSSSTNYAALEIQETRKRHHIIHLVRMHRILLPDVFCLDL